MRNLLECREIIEQLKILNHDLGAIIARIHSMIHKLETSIECYKMSWMKSNNSIEFIKENPDGATMNILQNVKQNMTEQYGLNEKYCYHLEELISAVNMEYLTSISIMQSPEWFYDRMQHCEGLTYQIQDITDNNMKDLKSIELQHVNALELSQMMECYIKVLQQMFDIYKEVSCLFNHIRELLEPIPPVAVPTLI